MNFTIILKKSKDVYQHVKDSCDRSGLNTIESSKDSHPYYVRDLVVMLSPFIYLSSAQRI